MLLRLILLQLQT